MKMKRKIRAKMETLIEKGNGLPVWLHIA